MSPESSRLGIGVPASADDAPYPVLVLEADGQVAGLNDAASDLLPSATTGRPLGFPSWLATAGRADASGPVSGKVGDRVFSAHPSSLPGDRTAWWMVDETAYQSAVDELRTERERTQFLTAASSALLSSLNLDRCMEVTARLAAEHLADAAVVVAPGTRRLPVVGCDQQGRISHTVNTTAPETVQGLAEALRGFPPVPSRWIDPSTAPDWLVPKGFGRVGSMAITPLPGHGVPAGVLVLLRRAENAAFTESEETFAGLFAARAGAAMSAARLYQEQSTITDTLMRELLPPTLERVQGVEFAGGYRPSRDHERIGGDFYDVHPADEDCAETLAILGDVCGKGLEAAVLTGKIRNSLQVLRPMAEDHGRMLRLLNQSILSSHHTRFVTLVLASVRREESEVALRLTSAGHPKPLIVRCDASVEEADTGGTLVGALPNVTSRTTEVRLAPGETCLLFTDGITEAVGGPLGDTMFGEERLRRALSECAGIPAAAVVERIQIVASEWVGDGHHDDIAVLAITASRGAHLSAVDGTSRGRYTP
ncbi:PP2C family protein-serine/threonine phosphatase [Streptomyces sp. NPDC096193]|uniref:PP2C family protein-serine/threonine phosphatase n=1 Tax=Streptomyces sp. NPDC096193 TaxID=3155821 RepID=UPI00331D4893